MTTRHYIQDLLLRTVAAAVMLLAGIQTALAEARANDLRYTNDRPLRIVSDWNFAPYEYSNDKGEPEGYNIDVLRTILDRLKVPHVFVMKEWSQALRMFNAGEADLLIEPFNNKYKYKNKPFYSRKTLAPYKIKVAYKRGTDPITKLSQMKPTDKLTLKKYDYATMIVLERSDIDKKQLRFWSPKMSLQELNSGRYQYFVWGEKPLQRMVKELNLTEIELSDIDIPAGEMRFVSHDKQLIDELDDQFARLEQSGMVHRMQTKWFHPEKHDDDASPVVLFIIIVAIIIVLIIFFANRMITARIKKGTQHSFEKNMIMQAALNMSGNSVISIDLKRRIISNVYGEHVPEEGMTTDQYRERIHPEDRESTKAFIERVAKNGTENEGHTYRWNAGTEQQPEWRVISNSSIGENDKNGKVINIISTLTDITNEQASEQTEGELTAKYSSIFEMSIVGLSLYDRNGYLINANRKMRSLMRFEGYSDEFYHSKCLFEFASIKDAVDRDNIEEVHFCSRIDVPERGVSEYLETRVRPIRDDDGELVYILVTVRPISEERDLYQQRKLNNDKLRMVNKKIAQSEDELRYLLKESNTRVWRSSFADRMVTFYKDLHNSEAQISTDDIVERVSIEEDKTRVREFIDPPMGNVTPQTITMAVNDIITGDGKRHWYSINRIPDYDESGNVTGCFGLIRDITDLMEAQEKLKQETQRANESEQQKSVFLANMSHEIRTPLNAIVGFCDLLQSIDSPDDRKEFIRIIRNNCNMLLHLINDILIISSMDSNGLTIEPREVDFAASFDDVCATFVQQVAEAGLEFIRESPCRKLITRLDNDRIQQVIVNFMTNAIKHTSRGHIRTGYRVEDGGLRIYCEDTGSGIPKEKSDDVFRRFVKLNDFVQGTGLGLSICKAIADSCGGRIGVESEVGHGATFWIWIPCEIQEIEYKEENKEYAE